MAAKRHGISPDLLIHPGETISDILAERNMTQKELAVRTGVSEPFLSDVIHGKKDISRKLASGLEYALGVSCSFWLNLQANYDAELIGLQEEATIQPEEHEMLTTIQEVVDYLKSNGLLPADLTREQTILRLRKYFRVSSLGGLRELVPAGAFRMADAEMVVPEILGAWLCLCKTAGECREITASYDDAMTEQLIAEIKKVMCLPRVNLRKVLPALFARYGIDFGVMRSFRGAPVQGYIERKGDGTYQIVLTVSDASADVFWLSVFHELGHIVNGDLTRPGGFIDTKKAEDSDREAAADRFAAEALLDAAGFEAFVRRGAYYQKAIKEYARSQNVPSFVVIGRLRKEKIISPERFDSSIPRYKWAE